MIFYSYEYDLNFAGDAFFESKIDVSRHDLLENAQLQEQLQNGHEVESSSTNAVIVDLDPRWSSG